MAQITKKPFLTAGRGALIAIALVVVLGISWAVLGSKGETVDSSLPLSAVVKGPLTISVTASGNIVSRDVSIILNELEGKATIIWLIEEGTMVKQGDLLVEFDSSFLLDERVDRTTAVQTAEASWIRSRENLAVAENQAKADIEDATLKFQFAKQDLEKYIDGEYPNERREAESRITLANEEVERATEKLQWSEKLFAEKYISETEFKADKLSAQKADLELELAKQRHHLLIEYTYKRKLAELEANVTQAEMALERTQRKSSSDVLQAKADLEARISELERARGRLIKVEEQIVKTRIVAPVSGQVVYATSVRGMRNQEPLAAGQEARERGELIYLPTASAVKAEVKVHESSMRKVRQGLPAMVTVDALPNRVFWGRVARIAPLPDAQSMWSNPDLKVYSTDVFIDGDGSELRTGMSCRVEIIMERYDDAIHVPLQAVTRVEGQPVVYVIRDGKQERRDVEVGLDNGSRIRIISGLQEGEKVLLTPPLAPARSEVLDPRPAQDIDSAQLQQMQEIPINSGQNNSGTIRNRTDDGESNGAPRQRRPRPQGGEGTGPAPQDQR